MESMANAIGPLIESGLGNLAAYLAAHVLLCLVPAFFIAGAMAALIPQEAVTRFLGRDAHKAVSYPAAAAAGSLLAVCSCTIVPLFAGIYRKGAGLGPAITFLFFAPAANILALVYTGGVIGVDLAVARFVLSLAFGIGIGLIMALLFRARRRGARRGRRRRVRGAGRRPHGPRLARLPAAVGRPAARRHAQARLPHGHGLRAHAAGRATRDPGRTRSTASCPTTRAAARKA